MHLVAAELARLSSPPALRRLPSHLVFRSPVSSSWGSARRRGPAPPWRIPSRPGRRWICRARCPLEHSSGNGTEHQVIGDKCAEDHLISSSVIPSEITPEASRTDADTLTTVTAQYSEKGTPIEDGDQSDPAVGSEKLEDVPTSALSAEPEDGAKCGSEISEHEKQNTLSEHEPQSSTVVPLESNATGGGTSEQTDDVVSQVNGIAVTEEDDTVDTLPLPKPSRANRRSFCIGGPHRYREITVVTLPGQQQQHSTKIKYVEMEIRPGEDLPPPVDSDDDSCSDYDDESDEELVVAPYWKATIWTMPVPIGSWKDWHKDKDCRVDVKDILVNNPRHCDLLLPLPCLRTDGSVAMSLRRLCTAYPTLELDANGELIIYLLSKVDSIYSEGWVIAVGARDKKLRGIAELDSRKNKYFMRCYRHTDISKYLMGSAVEVGALVQGNVERRFRLLGINI